ncbi:MULTISPECIES: polysaccharide deacetylase family protein [unclassified Lysinibacillus]|uniref:polysaccharide deacetylase family protein n=1 Tax=unclassified Lysinibacillus TaxID=2636778 RepID=UPI0025534498|nr:MULTISPECIES: polysaccharide deacetylase family protein [unclassified Lysinibacillus]MDM5248301.1 polysaccharide deacetylase family protein [Lysinibacillus sp. G4S2]
MKKFFLLVLPICLLTVSFFYVKVSAEKYEHKGRKYYEEAGQIVWEVKTDEKIIALTFDDGPHRKYTSQILDVLDKYNAKATFFIVGQNVDKNAEVISRMYNDGHELANHTFSHPLRTNVPNLLKEIEQTNKIIYNITGFTPTLFRPVEGQYSDAMIEAIAKEKYKVVMWSWHLDTLDWKSPGTDRIVNTVLKGVKEGNIVLFHDGGGNRQQTVKALEKILPELEKQGYRFVTVSELLDVQSKKDKNK